MFHGLGDLVGCHPLATTFVDESPRLVEKPAVSLTSHTVEGAVHLIDGRVGLVPDRGADLAGFDERHPHATA